MSAALGSPVESTDATDFEDRTPPLQHVVCHWSTADGEVVMESSDDTFGMDHEPFLIEKFGAPLGGTAVDGLGTRAYSGTEFPGTYVAWAEDLGEIDRTISISGGTIPVGSLEAVARAVDGTATAGSDAAPATGPSGGAEALLGTWTLTSAAGDPAPADPVVTLTFGADGTWVLALDCKPPKGKKAFSWKDTYTADATTVDMAPATSTGSCKDRSLSDFINLFSFNLAMATQPGAWTIAGDLLSITGGPEVTLEFQRAAP